RIARDLRRLGRRVKGKTKAGFEWLLENKWECIIGLAGAVGGGVYTPVYHDCVESVSTEGISESEDSATSDSESTSYT
ncbi:MAG: hypothetical protein LBT58_03705, partial [Endomicrobium sp.]|nr:hypothetical protein [Endomicrobium sp.]